MGFLSAIRGTGVAKTPPSESLAESAPPSSSSTSVEHAEQIQALISLSEAAEAQLTERIAELELSLEDQGWNRITGALSDFEFSTAGIKKIIRLSRIYYLKNPIIRRPVELQAYYVWGQGVSIHADNQKIDDVVQRFIGDADTMRTFSGHQALMDNERLLRVEGNLFLRLFPAPGGSVQVRRLPVDQILDGDIITNPDDSSEVWFYVRRWRPGAGAEERVEAYPDWEYERRLKSVESRYQFSLDDVRQTSVDLPMTNESVPIDWSTPVMHKKVGALPDMKFGVPETYAAIDWARAYKEALEDYKKIVKSLAKWAWKLKSGSDQASVNAARAALESTLGASGYATDQNAPPVAGSTFVYRQGIDLETVDVSKAIIDPEGFNRLMLMACAAMGTPSNFYGDAASGNLASAKTLDRPTELMFRDRQIFHSEIITDVLTFVVETAASSALVPEVKSAGYEKNGTMKITVGGKEADLDIKIDFPPILQQDAREQVQALVSGLTLNGQALQVMNDGPTIIRLLLTALGVEDIDEIVELFYPKDDSEPQAKPIETFPPPPTPAEAAAQAAADAAVKAALPTGNQPTSQGPAGAANRSPKKKGGEGAVAAQESSAEEDELESQARIEFMNALVEMRHALQEGRPNGNGSQ